MRLTPSPAQRTVLQQALRASPAGVDGQAAAPPGRGLDAALIARSPVPVLIPDIAGAPTRVYLVPDVNPDAYAATVELPGQNLVVMGSAKAFMPPPGTAPAKPSAGETLGNLFIFLAYRAAHPNQPPPRPEMLPQNVRFSTTEYGTEISFEQFGAPYEVSLVCDASPEGGDPRCSQAAAMLVLVRLLLVGGGAGW